VASGKKQLKSKEKRTSIVGMTTNELAELEGVARKTVTMWCQKNGVKRKMGVNGIMEYDLTNKDIEKFKSRKPKGRPKKSKK